VLTVVTADFSEVTDVLKSSGAVLGIDPQFCGLPGKSNLKISFPVQVAYLPPATGCAIRLPV